MQELKVKSTAHALVCKFEALPHIRYVGYRFSQVQGTADANGKKSGGFVQLDDVVTLPNIAEYIKALQSGDLVPADFDTAQAAGLSFSVPQDDNKKGNK
jgi:hypothetical protein